MSSIAAVVVGIVGVVVTGRGRGRGRGRGVVATLLFFITLCFDGCYSCSRLRLLRLNVWMVYPQLFFLPLVLCD